MFPYDDVIMISTGVTTACVKPWQYCYNNGINQNSFYVVIDLLWHYVLSACEFIWI